MHRVSRDWGLAHGYEGGKPWDGLASLPESSFQVGISAPRPRQGQVQLFQTESLKFRHSIFERIHPSVQSIRFRRFAIAAYSAGLQPALTMRPG